MIQKTRSIMDLIPEYYEQKQDMEALKKLVDQKNKEIKMIMRNDGAEECVVGDYVAKYSTQKRQSMNEEAMIDIIHEDPVLYAKAEDLGIIKTKEYIDFDALEDAIYKDKISKSSVLEFDKAREVKEVEVLKVVKRKKEEK